MRCRWLSTVDGTLVGTKYSPSDIPHKSRGGVFQDITDRRPIEGGQAIPLRLSLPPDPPPSLLDFFHISCPPRFSRRRTINERRLSFSSTAATVQDQRSTFRTPGIFCISTDTALLRPPCIYHRAHSPTSALIREKWAQLSSANSVFHTSTALSLPVAIVSFLERAAAVRSLLIR